jgi:GTP-binding protein
MTPQMSDATSTPNPFAGTRFIMSAARAAQLPQDLLAEAAFVGRSNSGKSSALNAVCQQRQLARVSRTPGRTQLINLFGVPAGRPRHGAVSEASVGTAAPEQHYPSDAETPILGRLVDLPGYGFAQVPEPIRREWGLLVGGYVEKRPNLRGLIVLMDIRHPLTDLDRQMLEWCAARAIPGHVLLTKADKLGRGAAKSTLLKVRAELKSIDDGLSVQTFSAPELAGVEEVRELLMGWLQRTVTA